jgi:hypothetical protein
MLMYGGQNMLRRLRQLTDIGNQQQRDTINDSQAFLIHSLMERVLKQGDTIAEMETTLVGIKNSLDAFKSVIQKVETNTSLSIPNLLTPIKNQVDQIPVLKKDILELQNKVEILQTSLEQFKIEQYKRNNKTNTNCWWNKLIGFMQTRNNKKGKGIPAVLERTGDTQEGTTTIGVKQDGDTVTMTKTELQTLIFVTLLTGGIIGSLLLWLTK